MQATSRGMVEARIARQNEIDASVAAKAEFEFLYDKPYEDKIKVRVAGPFTVESLSPHRVLAVDENGEFGDPYAGQKRMPDRILFRSFWRICSAAGVQQAHKEDKITFTSLAPWPGECDLRQKAVCRRRERRSEPLS